MSRTESKIRCGCTVEVGRSQSCASPLSTKMPVSPFAQLERGIEVEALASGGFCVTNFTKNCGGPIYSGGVWSPTCINPEGKTLRIPLGEYGVTRDAVKVVTP